MDTERVYDVYSRKKNVTPKIGNFFFSRLVRPRYSRLTKSQFGAGGAGFRLGAAARGGTRNGPRNALPWTFYGIRDGMEWFRTVWNGCDDLWDTLRRCSLPVVQLSAAGTSPGGLGAAGAAGAGGLARERAVPLSDDPAPQAAPNCLPRCFERFRTVCNGLEWL